MVKIARTCLLVPPPASTCILIRGYYSLDFGISFGTNFQVEESIRHRDLNALLFIGNFQLLQ